VAHVEDVDVAGDGERNAGFLHVEQRQASGHPEPEEDLPDESPQVREPFGDVTLEDGDQQK
jgi:hypothetical protein